MKAVAEDALILSFDTATRCCSIALTRGGPGDGEIVASIAMVSEITHSRRLLGSLDWLLRQAGIGFAEVAAVAFGLGPGSFTGLRIGMATAKGLCHGAAKPLLGISSLDAIGVAIDTDELVCVVLDARKQEVYNCFYRRTDDGTVVRCSEPGVGRPEDVARRIDEPVVMAGDGVAAYGAIWKKLLGTNLRSAAARYRYPSAEMVGLLAARPFRDGSFLDLDTATPLYIRSSDAELSLVQQSAKAKVVTESGEAGKR